MLQVGEGNRNNKLINKIDFLVQLGDWVTCVQRRFFEINYMEKEFNENLGNYLLENSIKDMSEEKYGPYIFV